MVLPVTTLDDVVGGRVAVVRPHMIDGAARAAARAALEATGYRRLLGIDRAAAELCERPDLPALVARARTLATAATGGAGVVRACFAVRLRAGDYVLAHHDLVESGPIAGVEVMFDLSEAVVPGAVVHYRRRGQVYAELPSDPSAAAVVERGPAVTSNHTYLSKAFGAATVVRLVVRLG